MNKKSLIAGFLLGVLLTGTVASGLFLYKTMRTAADAPTGVNTEKKISLIESLIDEKFLEDVDESDLTDGMLKGLIGGLDDPYAAYYTADEYKELQESTEGDYKGIGLVMQKDPDTKDVKVVGVYEGTPAEKAGIEAGDILLKVNDMTCADSELDEVAAAIKSDDSDTVHLTIERDEETIEADVEKTDIEIPVVAEKMLDDHIGYIQIAQFTSLTSEQFKESYQKLQDEKMTSLIIDLRNNPGGLLNSVVDTLKQILPEGMIVYTKTKDGKKTEYTCEGDSPIDIPLVVLVNGSSASAAEIFAGAVHDHGIGTLVGTTTYGKGIVQQTFPFTDGTAIKMTIAYYYTPNGTCIHEKGITPDVEIELPEDAKEDVQLNKAIEVIKEK